jgi:ABC-type transporter Mla MlaB component
MKNVYITTALKGNNSVYAVLKGELVIRESEALKTEFVRLLQNHETINIRLQEVSRIDVSVLQLLVAFSNSAVVLNKKLSYQFDDSPYLQKTLSTSGFGRFLFNTAEYANA